MTEKDRECVEYLKSRTGYQRIIGAIIEKYKRLGKLGGYIVLTALNADEQQLLAPLDYNVYESRKCKISVEKFIKYFCSGKFEGADFMEVLEAYYGQSLISHKTHKANVQLQQEEFFRQLEKELENEWVKKWICDTLTNRLQGYNLLVAQYKEDGLKLKDMIQKVDCAIRKLSQIQDFLPLVILSTEVTKDPHYFDGKTRAFRVLLYVLCYKQGVQYPESIYEKNEVLYKEKILRDEISTSTITYGLEGYEGEESQGWQVFSRKCQPIELMLYNLKNITHIHVTGKKVYIVENPTVFSLILEKVKEQDIGLVCTRGQLGTADRLLIELLVKGDNYLYYNGDFDPEGLQIAQKVKELSPERITLWGYEKKRYQKSQGIRLDEERLSKLESIYRDELIDIKESIKEQHLAVYQEELIDQLVEDVIKSLENLCTNTDNRI